MSIETVATVLIGVSAAVTVATAVGMTRLARTSRHTANVADAARLQEIARELAAISLRLGEDRPRRRA